MNRLEKHTIIFDTEYEWDRDQLGYPPPAGTLLEIIQIGALKIDLGSFTVLDRLNLLIKPKDNPVLSEYFCNLTHISNESVVTQGISFGEAAQRFMNFCGDSLPYAYGHDTLIMIDNMRRHQVSVPPKWPTNKDNNITNLQSWFHTHAPETQTVNSGRLASTLGLATGFEGEHDALFDCYSILRAMQYLIQEKTCPIPDFKDTI